MQTRDLVKLGPSERKAAMKDIFGNLLKLNHAQLVEQLKGFLLEVQKVATDRQYEDLCLTNLQIIVGLDDKTLKEVVKARIDAQKALPADARKRDEKALGNALAKCEMSDKIKAALK